MSHITWSSKYSVGIEEIDTQHKEFIRIANEILAVVNEKAPGKDVILDLVNKLGNYSLYHLSSEEKLFKEYEYPDAQVHIQSHDEFRKTVKELVNNVRDAKENEMASLAKKLASFSGNWLIQHIMSVDQKYTEFFKEKGLK